MLVVSNGDAQKGGGAVVGAWWWGAPVAFVGIRQSSWMRGRESLNARYAPIATDAPTLHPAISTQLETSAMYPAPLAYGIPLGCQHIRRNHEFATAIIQIPGNKTCQEGDVAFQIG